MPGPAAHIFREYDVRGIVGADLDAGVARGVGRAYAAELRSRLAATPAHAGGSDGPADARRGRVVVGRDNRPTSPALADALIAGLRSGGVDVIDIGTVPTPMVWWAEKTMGLDGGIQITGSHNPSEWNGIKIDESFFDALNRKLGAELLTLEQEIHLEAGTAFNINSNPQLRVILFEKLELPVKKRTSTGPSTDVTVLQELDTFASAKEIHGELEERDVQVGLTTASAGLHDAQLIASERDFRHFAEHCGLRLAV